MSDRLESSSHHNRDYKHRRNFTAKETDHIKVQSSSNGSSSGSRFSPYVRPNSTSSSHKPKHDDERKQENVYHVPTQKYPKFEAKSSPSKVEIKPAKVEIKPAKVEIKPAKKKMTVAAVFNCDSSDEEEEIPLHAKMRMRNVGKDTPTSSGPNSFGKTKRGFTDTVKMWEKDPVKVAQFIVEKQKEGETPAGRGEAAAGKDE
ncbi:PEST proteolytic signal-containing nuclear protein-like [Bolinopsis microptera]|uniref:PEST proteolytic signal-containing nuclear protein-like n=1 Tax=Bolinopsis microptera TaxID=2820187 RepID=UPI00307A6E19